MHANALLGIVEAVAGKNLVTEGAEDGGGKNFREDISKHGGGRDVEEDEGLVDHLVT